MVTELPGVRACVSAARAVMGTPSTRTTDRMPARKYRENDLVDDAREEVEQGQETREWI